MAYSDEVIEAARKQLSTIVEEVAACLQYSLGVTRITTDTDSEPDLAAMRRQYFLSHSVTVWTGASDRTIYTRSDINTAFRFWHGYVHIVHNFGFTYEDEREVNRIQRKTIEYHVKRRRGTLHDDVLDAVLELFDADTNGQLDYHAMAGEFPHDQLYFAKCILNGTFSTLKTTSREITMKDIVIQKHLLDGYLWMKQNAMALRDSGEVHPAFRRNGGTCSTMWMYGEHLTPIGGEKLSAAHDIVLGEYVEDHIPDMVGDDWPFGFVTARTWENPKRLAFIDWAITKIEQRIAELENTNG